MSGWNWRAAVRSHRTRYRDAWPPGDSAERQQHRQEVHPWDRTASRSWANPRSSPAADRTRQPE